MSPPTAGSMHVDKSYQGLPLWRTAGWLLLHFSGIFVAAMFCWYTWAFYTLTGRMYPRDLAVTAITVLYLAAVICWKMAKPATSIESLNLTKATNICVMLAFVLKCLHVWKYHVTDIKQYLFPRQIWKYLSEEKGYSSGYILPAMETLEAVADGGTIIFVGLTLVCFQNYISGKMQIIDKLERAKKSGNKEAIAAAQKEEQKALDMRTAPGMKRRKGRA